MTAKTQNTPVQTAHRISTGCAGLDTILLGGFLRGSVFILEGSPGAGKTVLANQVCFHQAQAGERSVYVTLLAESHDRLLKNLSSMSFFDADLWPMSIDYISGFHILTTKGLNGILELIMKECRARNASMLVLDGLFVLEENVQSEREFRKFVNDVTNLAALMDCTVLLLTNSRQQPQPRPEHTMVDGWIEMNTHQLAYRAYRDLSIRKYRGSDFIPGRHSFTISDEGVRVFPRLETVTRREIPEAPLEGRVSSGLPALDKMVSGGFPAATTSLLFGPTGAGKTTLALQFAAAATAEEPALFYSLYEAEVRLRMKSERLGLNVGEMMDRGLIHFIWTPPSENLLDELGNKLLRAIKKHKIKRLVLDGVDAFDDSAVHPERLPGFLNALNSELRRMEVSSLFTTRTEILPPPTFSVNLGNLSAVAENILLLRYEEEGKHLRRYLSVLKVRDSAFDPLWREYTISQGGILFTDGPRDPASGTG
ncbi:ATPase domain-containing protein [Telmatospirillum sp. J64-1]|uniref:RAD55 family ATPase n=1 Tax=Telmatospirillum sp. J64-1 TaxID=2502183 RepID=UPI00115D585B|nr:ATPase domain-containing protein [Telmatospirillum sp. J64-1]